MRLDPSGGRRFSPFSDDISCSRQPFSFLKNSFSVPPPSSSLRSWPFLFFSRTATRERTFTTWCHFSRCSPPLSPPFFLREQYFFSRSGTPYRYPSFPHVTVLLPLLFLAIFHRRPFPKHAVMCGSVCFPSMPALSEFFFSRGKQLATKVVFPTGHCGDQFHLDNFVLRCPFYDGFRLLSSLCIPWTERSFYSLFLF